MAHNIKSFAYAGAKPWHKLGTPVPGLMTVSEALKFGGLDYTVEKRPAYHLREVMNADGIGQVPIKVPHRWVTVRTDTDTPLGVVGDRYTIVQNSAAFDFFDAAVGEGTAMIETVGALGEGERVFMMAKTPECMEVVPGDPVEGYLLFENTHDGSAQVRCLFTAVRVVCQNTVNAAIAGAQHVHKIRHTASAGDKLRLAHTVLAASTEYWQRWQSGAQAMAKRDMSRLDTLALLYQLFPGKSGRAKNIRSEVQALADGRAKGADIPGVQGTAWGVYNSVTEYLGDGRTTRNGNTNWEAETFGSGVAVRQAAWDLLTA